MPGSDIDGKPGATGARSQDPETGGIGMGRNGKDTRC